MGVAQEINNLAHGRMIPGQHLLGQFVQFRLVKCPGV
jgi:hypothetical protein